jgi:hypothetical protein
MSRVKLPFRSLPIGPLSLPNAGNCFSILFSLSENSLSGSINIAAASPNDMSISAAISKISKARACGAAFICMSSRISCSVFCFGFEFG